MALPFGTGSLPASGLVPGRICREGAANKAWPPLLSNRVASTICRSGPPTSSQGNQKLYECPNLDSL
jgi:hypothetical protein